VGVRPVRFPIDPSNVDVDSISSHSLSDGRIIKNTSLPLPFASSFDLMGGLGKVKDGRDGSNVVV